MTHGIPFPPPRIRRTSRTSRPDGRSRIVLLRCANGKEPTCSVWSIPIGRSSPISFGANRNCSSAAIAVTLALGSLVSADRLVIGSQTAPSSAPFLVVGDEILAPLLPELPRLGAQFDRERDKVTITTAQGRKITLPTVEILEAELKELTETTDVEGWARHVSRACLVHLPHF